ncbi:MAG: hypothetical protein AAB475_01005 [Patescibacteria group bacterium]
MNKKDIYELLKGYREDLDNLDSITKCEDIQKRRSELEKMLQSLSVLLINISKEKITPILFNTIELFNNEIQEKIWDTKRKEQYKL